MILRKLVLVVSLLLSVTIAFSVFMPVQAVTIPTSELQLYYKFDEGSGSVTYDSSGHGRNGLLGSNATWTTGKVNSAAKFNGTGNSYVDAGHLNASSNDWSVALWFTSNNIGGDWHDVYAQGSWGSPGHFEITVDVSGTKCGSAGMLALIAWNLTPNVICSASGNLNDNQIHHVVVTYNHTYVSFYLNGLLNNQVAATGNIGNTTLRTCIGDRDSGSNSCLNGGYPWKGIADEVLVYSRALSSSEVQQIYTYGFQVTTTVTSVSTSTRTVTSTSTTTSVRSSTTTITQTTTSPEPFTILTNSTVLNYLVNGNGINLTVTGPSGTVGHTKVSLLKSFFSGNPIIYLDNGHSNLIPPTAITSNSTHWTLNMYYEHSTHTISIVGNITSVPEFPAAPLLIPIAVILSLIVLRRKTVKSP